MCCQIAGNPPENGTNRCVEEALDVSSNLSDWGKRVIQEEYTETAKSYGWQDMYWYSLAWCGGERCLAGLKIPDIAPSRDTTMVGDTGQIGSLASGQKPCQCLNRGPPRKNPNSKLQFYCIVALLFEYVVVMVLKLEGFRSPAICRILGEICGNE